ncbi:hypothetical protein NM688_g5152 [Phlebia brevispora]|uniref:Uncharacterized protein n=1 Tax=Phlebia brevispora TaxID=194682 RepID=A0ACC1SZS2_9APHY|nr:hypothetical protein NM688_g5152 [Phlebia brevispora]
MPRLSAPFPQAPRPNTYRIPLSPARRPPPHRQAFHNAPRIRSQSHVLYPAWPTLGRALLLIEQGAAMELWTI